MRKIPSSGALAALLVMLLSVSLGIASRRWGPYLPGFIARYAGDTFWALGFFAFFRLLFRQRSLARVAALTLIWSFIVEFSQLWHPKWLEALRAYTAGGLILGYGFRWSDLACYAAGCVLGHSLFTFIHWRLSKNTNRS